MDVVVEGDRIIATGSSPARPGSMEIDGRGCVVLPGLIDAHTHLTGTVEAQADPLHPAIPFVAARRAREKLAAGITTVRDLGGVSGIDFALRDAIRRGDVPGPRVLAAGRVICSTGGHIWYWGHEADGPVEIRKAVRAAVKAGADVIKVMVSAGVAHPGERPEHVQLGPDELNAACEEAQEAGLRVAAHAHPARGIRSAIAAGATSIEHGTYLDDDVIELMIARRVFLVPTQCVYQRLKDNIDGWPEEKAALARALWDTKSQRLQRAVGAGVRIGVGTDSGRHYPSNQIVPELELLVHAGMRPADAILAATRTNAELLGIESEVGTIAPGMVADLVLVEGDPLTRITDLSKVRLVLARGEVLDPTTLLASRAN